MVKKTVNAGMFAKTETPQAQTDEQIKAEKAKRRRPVGVYLRVGTRSEIEKIAAAEGLSVHAVLAYSVAYFVRQYKAGKVKIETTQKTTLKMDV